LAINNNKFFLKKIQKFDFQIIFKKLLREMKNKLSLQPIETVKPKTHKP